MELPTGFDSAGIGPNAFTQCPAAYIYYTQVSVTSVNMMFFTDLTVGDSYRLAATINPSNATDQRLVWASDNPAAAAVDQDGNVTGLASGMADIYAYAADGSGKYEYCTFDVSAPLATGLSIVPETVDLYPGGTAQLSVAMTPSNASQDVTWSSANDAFVSVDQNGLVTAKQNADIYVYARTTDGSNLMAICVVHVHPPAVDFKIQNVSGDDVSVGDIITVPITYNNHGNAIGDGSTVIKYDSENLDLVTYNYPTYLDDSDTQLGALANATFNDQPGALSIAFAKSSDAIPNSGDYLTLVFQVIKESGVYPVNLEVNDWDAYNNADGITPTKLSETAGAIQVTGYAGQTASMTNTAAPGANGSGPYTYDPTQTELARFVLQVIVGKTSLYKGKLSVFANPPYNTVLARQMLQVAVGKLIPDDSYDDTYYFNYNIVKMDYRKLLIGPPTTRELSINYATTNYSSPEVIPKDDCTDFASWCLYDDGKGLPMDKTWYFNSITYYTISLNIKYDLKTLYNGFASIIRDGEYDNFISYDVDASAAWLKAPDFHSYLTDTLKFPQDKVNTIADLHKLIKSGKVHSGDIAIFTASHSTMITSVDVEGGNAFYSAHTEARLNRDLDYAFTSGTIIEGQGYMSIIHIKYPGES